MGPVESLCSSELYSLDETTANFCKGLERVYLKNMHLKFTKQLKLLSPQIFEKSYHSYLATDKKESRFKYHLTNCLRINSS